MIISEGDALEDEKSVYTAAPAEEAEALIKRGIAAMNDITTPLPQRDFRISSITSPRAEVLHEAEKLICGTRQQEYGSPYDSHARIAGLWSALLGIEIRPYQAAVMLACMKASRAMTDVKMDTFNDGAGYFALAYDILLEEEQQ